MRCFLKVPNLTADRLLRTRGSCRYFAEKECMSPIGTNTSKSKGLRLCMRRRFSEHSNQIFSKIEPETPTYTRRASDAWPAHELSVLPPHIRPHKDETLDLILRRKIFLLQARRGYRCNVDSHILANFASSRYQMKQSMLENSYTNINDGGRSLSKRRHPRVLDLGAGSGIVSILFCRKHHFNRSCLTSSDLQMIEFQPQLADRARRNLVLNDLDGTVVEHDIGDGNLPKSLHRAFDVVLVNPPFYQAEKRTASKVKERRLAQLESSATFSNFMVAARAACDTTNPHAFVAVIQDITEGERIFDSVRQNNMGVKAYREMRHHNEAGPTRLLLELEPIDGCVSTEKVDGEKNESQLFPNMKPLTLFKDGRIADESMYTEEIENFFDSLPYPSLHIGQLREVE